MRLALAQEAHAWTHLLDDDQLIPIICSLGTHLLPLDSPSLSVYTIMMPTLKGLSFLALAYGIAYHRISY